MVGTTQKTLEKLCAWINLAKFARQAIQIFETERVLLIRKHATAAVSASAPGEHFGVASAAFRRARCRRHGWTEMWATRSRAMHFRGGIWLPSHFADGDRRVGCALRNLYRGRRIAEGGRCYSGKGSGCSCFVSSHSLSHMLCAVCTSAPRFTPSRVVLLLPPSVSLSLPLLLPNVDMFVVMYMNLSLEL